MLFAFVSCEKLSFEDPQQPNQTNLTVSVFQLEQTPFAEVTRTAAIDACTRINFAIFNIEGSRVKQVNQQLEDADFGTASFQLPEGNYLLVVVAHSCNGNPTMTDSDKIQFTNTTGYSDTFLYCKQVTIGEDAVEMQISLDRIVSLCRFVITDNIPSDVAKMQFYYTGGSGAFNATTGLGCVNSKQTVTYNVAAGQKQFDLYTFLHAAEGAIALKVSALDLKENVLYEREFNIPLSRNQITWFSGSFFSGNNPQALSASLDINTAWNGEKRLTY